MPVHVPVDALVSGSFFFVSHLMLLGSITLVSEDDGDIFLSVADDAGISNCFFSFDNASVRLTCGRVLL